MDGVKPLGCPETGRLTVGISTHDAGVLPAKLQCHPLQVAVGGRLFNQLPNLRDENQTGEASDRAEVAGRAEQALGRGAAPSTPWALAASPPGPDRDPAGIPVLSGLPQGWTRASQAWRLIHGHPRRAAELTSPAAHHQQQPVSPEGQRGGRSVQSFGLI